MKTRTAPDSGDRWQPLVVCPSAGLARALRPALGECGYANACILTEYPAPGAIPALLARYEANVCFLDVAANPEQALPRANLTQDINLEPPASFPAHGDASRQ